MEILENKKIVKVPEKINYRQALKNTTIFTSTVIYSSLHLEPMLTGFFNSEFGALRTLIELGQKIK